MGPHTYRFVCEPTRRLIRVSSALYNGPDDVERLADALRTLGAEG